MVYTATGEKIMESDTNHINQLIQIQKEHYQDMKDMVHATQQQNAQLISLLISRDAPIQMPLPAEPTVEDYNDSAMEGGEIR